MIPAILNEWCLESIINLLAKGYYEDDTFDFKERLPDSRDNDGKSRLVKSCCAFANSEGGFLVFGIKDDRSLSPTERIVGIDPTFDFPVHFGNYPKNCRPSVAWDFRNPAIPLSGGNVCHVVFIPKSWKAPHAVGNAETGWIFMKRTSKGNESMGYEEIRTHFLGFYEKRLKLQLLLAELHGIHQQAKNAVIDDHNISTTYSLATFDLRVIETILSETYTILTSRPKLLELLQGLRNLCNTANNKIQIFFSTVPLPLDNMQKTITDHNLYMREQSTKISGLASSAIEDLQNFLAPPSK